MQAEHPVIQDEGQDAVDLRALASRVARAKYWLMCGFAITLAAFVAAGFMLPKKYAASTVLVPVAKERGSLGSALGSSMGALGALASFAGVPVGNGSGATIEALAVLRSREFTESFIRDLGLMPILYASRWDATKNRWKSDWRGEPTIARAARRFNESIRLINEDRRTGLVTLTIRWGDPEMAAKWANLLVERLNAEMRTRAIRSSEASLGYLQRELAQTTVLETRTAIGRVLETQINERMLANVSIDYAFRVADRALAPDPADFVFPSRVFFAAAGVPAGAFVGLMLALVATRRRSG